MIDQILLGHNQFFGVNHLAANAGNERAAYFSDMDRIMEMINFSHDQGVKAMMMSTHERALFISEELQKDARLKDLGIYLLLPYAAKYIKMANEKGLVNIIKDSLSDTTAKEKFGMFWRGSVGVVKKDAAKIITSLIDVEMAQFSKLNLKAVFLHDVLTDLILGWDMPEIFKVFYDHVSKRYNAIPAFCSKNLPKIIDSLETVGIENPLIMASINKIGYQVSPSLHAFEECLRTKKVRLLAMSTLAAGYVKPKEAYEYLYSLPNIESTVVGVSKKHHATETFSIIQNHLKTYKGLPVSNGVAAAAEMAV